MTDDRPAANPPVRGGPDADLIQAAETLAASLLVSAGRRRRRAEKLQAARIARILGDPDGRTATFALTDEVLRIAESDRAAASFVSIADLALASRAFGPFDRLALAGGRRLAPVIPRAVIPLVRHRVRAEMAGVILPAGHRRLARHAARRRGQGIRLNINVLGEAVLGDDEAERRLARVARVLEDPAVDYVSVKVSSICAQLDVLAFDQEVGRIAGRLRTLYDVAGRYRPAKFVNLDMEEYRDLDLTVAVFRRVLDEPRYRSIGAGIVLQAYLPDSLGALEELCRWARVRHEQAGGWIKVRIVKGANLAMERVDAEVHGWAAAPFGTKAETDAHYKRLLEVALDPANSGAVRVGVATHNLFELAWAVSLAQQLGAADRIELEMLEGMSPAVAEAVADHFGGLLLYAPLVQRGELEAAIAYLVRRLDENGGPDNFIAHQFAMTVGSIEWSRQAERFELAVTDRHQPPVATRRTQDRSSETGAVAPPDGFVNEPDTDFTRPVNREWAAGAIEALRRQCPPDYGPVIAGWPSGSGPPVDGIDPSHPGRVAYRWRSAGPEEVEQALAAAEAGRSWGDTDPAERRKVLHSVAHELARRRGRLLAVMAMDAAKTVREGDPEVSEAVDFAAYYAEQVPDGGAGFRPYGTVVVASPWNFPLSIPAGGVLAALAGGNSVILKPAPETVAVAAELAQAVWAGGVPPSALQFVPCVDGDDSRRLITDPRVGAVILTGAWDTARTFLAWRPDLNLHAETSGKNSIVISATADLDQSIADLVRSAFGHAGQKCSAASLAIVEASVHDDRRFLPRLADAVRSLRVGPAAAATTVMGPLIRPPEDPLRGALTTLEADERWLVRPERLDEAGYLWSPGVKVGVAPGSPFHLTECFGPVLGVMRAPDLEVAQAWQNQPPYGLTAGLQALDPTEIAHWRDQVQAGNLYVNKGITGAVVRRQPFGGWKRSVVGPGAKAGGANYVASLGTWPSPAAPIGPADFRSTWRTMQDAVDETGLAAEANTFRLRPIRRVALWVGSQVGPDDVATARAAAGTVGTAVDVVGSPSDGARADKIRFLGTVDEATRRAAHESGAWTDFTPVAAEARRELLRWVREQAVSESRHRHGNITARRPGLPTAPTSR